VANQEDLLIKIEADTSGISKAIGGIDKEFKGLGKVITEANKPLTDFGASAIKLNQVLELAGKAFQGFRGLVEKSVGAYIESSVGIQNLSNTLSLLGQTNIPKTIASFREFAAQMQATTTAEDDQVIALLNMAKIMGQTDDQAKRTLVVAIDLAAALGKDLPEAFQMLKAAQAGQMRELAQYYPNLKNFTEEQLRQGAATEYLASRVSGFGEAAAATFSGKMTQLKNTIGDIMEDIGEIIFEGLSFQDALTEMKKAAKEFGEALSSIKNNAIAFSLNVQKPFKAVGSSIDAAFAGGLSALTGLVAKAASAIGQEDFAKKLKGDVKELDGAFSESLKGMKQEFVTANEVAAQIQKRLDDMARSKKAVAEEPMITDADRKLIDELAKKYEELYKKNRLAGISEYRQIGENAALELRLLKTLQDKVDLQIKNKDAIEKANKLIKDSEQQIKEARDKAQKALNEKELSDILAKNDTILASTESYYRTEFDLLDKKLADEKLITTQKALQLLIAGQLTDEAQNALEAQGKAIEAAAKTKVGAAIRKIPGEVESRVINTTFAKAFGEGSQLVSTKITSALGGAIGWINAILELGNAMLDFIPNMVKSIGALFDKITNFPNLLKTVFADLGKSVLNFTSEFIPNIFSELPALLDDAIDNFVIKIPEAFSKLLDGLPDLIEGLANRAPELVQKFVASFIGSLPRIFMAIIKNVPLIYLAFLKAFATFWIELGKAVYKGILEGWEQFKAGFKGVKAKVSVDVPTVVEAVKKINAQLTGAASKLFSVENLNKVAKSPKANKVISEVGKVNEQAKIMAKSFGDKFGAWWEGFKKGVGAFFTGLWQGLMGVFTNVWELITGLWKEIWAGLQKIGENLKIVWDYVIMWLTKLWAIIKSIWDGVLTVLQKLWDGLKAIWDGVLTVLQGLWDALKAIWDGVLTVLQGLWDTLAAVWGAVFKFFEGIGKIIGEAFKAVFDFFGSLGTKIVEAFKSVFEFFGSLGDKISEAFKSVFDFFGDLGNKLKFEEPQWLKDIGNKLKFDTPKWVDDLASKLTFKFETPEWLNDFINAVKKMSKIKGFPEFATGGIVGGRASTPGDSAMNDKILALVSPGEAVIPRSAMADPAIAAIVQNILSGRLKVPQFNEGALNISDAMASSSNPILAKTAAAGATVTNISMNVNIETKEALDESYLRNRLLPAMKAEIKRASLDGQFILSAKGIR